MLEEMKLKRCWERIEEGEVMLGEEGMRERENEKGEEESRGRVKEEMHWREGDERKRVDAERKRRDGE